MSHKEADDLEQSWKSLKRTEYHITSMELLYLSQRDVFICALFLALLAFVEERQYVIREAEQAVMICVILEGLLERDADVHFSLEDVTATGISYFSLAVRRNNPLHIFV